MPDPPEHAAKPTPNDPSPSTRRSFAPSRTGSRRAAPAARAALRLVDAPTIRLSGLSAWARVGIHHQAVKLHVAYDAKAGHDLVRDHPGPRERHRGRPGHAHRGGRHYVFDQGYYDFAFWAALDAAGCRFVTRRKVNTALAGLATRAADGKTLDLLTNDLEAAASQIAALYKARRQVALFFRWVKQNLRSKRFLGTGEQAIKWPILTALIAYLLLRLAQEARPGGASLHRLARRVKVNLMHRTTLADLLHPPPGTVDPTPPPPAPQLNLVFSHAHG